MQSVIYKRIPQCPADLLAEVAKYPVSDLHEALGPVEGRMQLMSSRMRPIAPGQRIAGQAVTSYNFPGDNLMIHAALNVAQRGQVLVLVNGGGAHGSLWGDVAATFAKQKGIAGIIVDGPARDVAALRELGSLTWSTSISSSHPEKRGPGAVNVPIVCDGVRVDPGDVIVADDDGALAIPLRSLERAVKGARERNRKEIELRDRLKTGSSLFELLQMDKNVQAAGAEIRDTLWIDG
ncbi:MULTISPECIES: RraA family protein [Bradyrhizobium]|uniref:4-carboxy-4-hydroxy-2-oxoadipate aldolase/oxaloacetate decarboxylase n=3 Tax=Bradyrhizobium TaxID=374 RepID=A0A410VIU4_9BRAD|nr:MULTISPECIES: dimethylmenaquinone methyltransferase [Bradyrhizobium]MCG2629470.1 dimethylmenaquinone methyltransferase [Bradyrhizobium zhengyangense]MCG2644902.1 dimethylmenaquinone methyltransferase [Bradyrhizobium zhengyangense]MCG2670984.1 dimethylmenaquinone methyltransferase [Bradyrhizobium zhengyangense]MDN4984619.1 dimethylmenaquinone methyltransferase [Bradyrhizobium sp. WYCCWR 13022]MDN5002611.1 dimethylmenaquinone methyltransferase [Bradyrhizobium sp. WYCCWR 12677]